MDRNEVIEKDDTNNDDDDDHSTPADGSVGSSGKKPTKGRKNPNKSKKRRKQKNLGKLIMSKLDDIAKPEAALNILAMNAAHRLRQWIILILHFMGDEKAFQ